MALTAAEKMKRLRARRRAGRAALTVDVDLDRVAGLLFDTGFIGEWDADDRQAIARALATALDVWARA